MGLGRPPPAVLLGDTGLYARCHRAATRPVRVQARAARRGGALVPRAPGPSSARCRISRPRRPGTIEYLPVAGGGGLRC